MTSDAVTEDTVCCSEVHSGASDTESRTRFLMRLSALESQPIREDIASGADTDGDLLVARRKKNAFNLAITISHRLASPLSLVGLQVWNGSLVMCDYLLTHPHSVEGHVVLELGSGTGLVAILAAHITSVVFATDYSAAVLNQCRENLEYNISSSLCLGKVHVGVLDWKRGFVPDLEDSSLKKYLYNQQQLELLRSSDVIIACDTIYDLDGVRDFLCCIERLVCESLHAEKVQLYLSMERRINFSLCTLSPGCLPYDALFQGIKQLQDKLSTSNIRVSWEQICLDGRQMVAYERSEYLQLWKIYFEKLSIKKALDFSN